MAELKKKATKEEILKKWDEHKELRRPPSHPPESPNQPRSIIDASEIVLHPKARLAANWMEKFLIMDDMGCRMRLAPYQLLILNDMFETDSSDRRIRDKLIFSAARKQGKSALAAAILLLEMSAKGFAPRGGWFFVGAGGSRDQAMVIWNHVRRMVERNEFLSKRFTIRTDARKITNLRNYNCLEALSTSAKSAQGREAYGYAFDELAQARNGALLNALEMSSRSDNWGTKMIVSTNNTDPGNILADKIDAVRGAQIQGEMMDWALHVYAADLSKYDMWDDQAIWDANPGLYADPPLLEMSMIEKDRVKARHSPQDRSYYKAYRLNSASGNTSAICDPEVWIDLMVPEDDIEEVNANHIGMRCALGVDLSKTTDISAVVAYFPETGFIKTMGWLPQKSIGRWTIQNKFEFQNAVDQGHLTACPGDVVDYNYIIDYIEDMRANYDVIRISYDPYMFPLVREMMKNRGLDTESDAFKNVWLPFRQGYISYTPAIAELEKLINTKRISYERNSILNMGIHSMMIEKSKANDASEARRPVKSTPISKIDAAVALLMAVAPVEMPAPKKVFVPDILINRLSGS